MQLNLRLEHKLRRKLIIKPIILLRSQILRYKHFYTLSYDFAIAKERRKKIMVDVLESIFENEHEISRKFITSDSWFRTHYYELRATRKLVMKPNEFLAKSIQSVAVQASLRCLLLTRRNKSKTSFVIIILVISIWLSCENT